MISNWDTFLVGSRKLPPNFISSDQVSQNLIYKTYFCKPTYLPPATFLREEFSSYCMFSFFSFTILCKVLYVSVIWSIVLNVLFLSTFWLYYCDLLTNLLLRNDHIRPRSCQRDHISFESHLLKITGTVYKCTLYILASKCTTLLYLTLLFLKKSGICSFFALLLLIKRLPRTIARDWDLIYYMLL